jgi:hypothetical protein
VGEHWNVLEGEPEALKKWRFGWEIWRDLKNANPFRSSRWN